MTSTRLPIPGPIWGNYPERHTAERAIGARCNDWLRAIGGRNHAWLQQRDRAFLAQVRAAESAHARGGVDEAALLALRIDLVRDRMDDASVARSFALLSQVAVDLLGQRPFDTQLVAARAVLECRLVEMATGEGKTLAVAIAAATAALAGIPVHVITANDYLAARDAQALAPFFDAFNLQVGTVVQPDSAAQRRQAYACDITYVTAREVVFDYLRDGLPSADRSQRLLRGLCMAIVDEADAVLIDDARMPLILSQPGDIAELADHATQALAFARSLRIGVDFILAPESSSAQLAEGGRRRLERAAGTLANASASPAWRNPLHREHAVSTALAALHLFVRDRHYLVRDGKVQIVDQNTGRIAHGRAWSSGLQQLIEIKEDCAPTPPLATVAQITYQRFFPRYLRLGGLSGTLSEAKAELRSTYRLTLRRIALRRRCLRNIGATRLFADHPGLWTAVSAHVATLHRRGLPVLIATDSVAESNALCAVLARSRLPHAVLHASADADEAASIARAGQRGAITVTTNIAGRGTDIELGAGIASLGGLQLICCQLNGARRSDRQLAGRSARQGDPGSVQTWLSLDTVLIARFWPVTALALLRAHAHHLPSWIVRLIARIPQRFEEARQRELRARLIRHDIQTDRALSFGGHIE